MKDELIFVVEKKADAALLRSLLTYCVPRCHFDFYAAQGKLLLASLATSIAVDTRCPVMVVGDTGTLDPEDAHYFEYDHLAFTELVVPQGMMDAFAFSPSLEQVVADAVTADPPGSEGTALEQRIAHTPLQQLRGHPQLSRFLEAVDALQLLLTPAPIEQAEQPAYEPAMK